MTTVTGGAGSGTFLGQPKQLATLFSVEMWERFSFYGLQGILLIYLYFSVADGGLGIDRVAATGIIGAYGGAVYLSTVLGAWLADRLLGAERMLFYSAILVMFGHIALSALPDLVGIAVGLVLIALGSGGVKANSTSLVGTLYAQGDIRRDAGFSIYYLGINLGAFLGPLLTGLVQKNLGFHLAFLLAALGMAFGLTVYAFGRRSFPAEARVVPNPLPRERRVPYLAAGLGLIAVITIAVTTGLLTVDRLSDTVVIATIVAAVVVFAVILSNRAITTVERRRVIAFIPLFLVSAVFWSLYQQQFTVLTLYSEAQLDRDIFGWTMPISWVNSINPVFIIVLSGVFAALWTKLGRRQPTSPVKFAAGTVVMGIAFLLFIPMASTEANSAPLLGLIGILFVFTVAELLISPNSLSLATKLAPRIYETQMVALLFLSIALGTAMSGVLAGYYVVESTVPGGQDQVPDVPEQIAYFGILGGIAIVVGAILWSVSRPILKLMGGVR